MFGLESLDAEAVYLRLPIALQNAACTFVGWRTERTRYAGAFDTILEEAVARTYWSKRDVEAFRDRRLVAAVQRAAPIPFYRDRFRAAGVEPTDIRGLRDLERLPILTKDEARDGLVAHLPPPPPRTPMEHTSGTTGGALRFPMTMAAIQERWAVWWRYRKWHGIDKGTWCALFTGRSVVPATQRRPPFWRVNRVGRQVLFSGYHMRTENLPSYVAELRRRRLPWLHGYPSLLALLAAHLLEARTDLGYEPRWVTTGAENLLPHQAAVIERAFGIAPIQHYGLAEAVANVSQCDRGRLHVDEDFAAAEFIPVGTEGLCRIVGTNITNAATPLLRYDTQDLATVSAGTSCACGRPGRIVDGVDGRLEDYVVLADGTRIGRMDHIFKDMINVREAQIHQKAPGAITMRIVRRAEYTAADEAALRRETAKRLGPEAEIRIEYVDALPRSRTGKLRFVVSELPGDSIGTIKTSQAAPSPAGRRSGPSRA